ncbi:MAG: molybdopterin-dependent oxidoreductase [Nitrososphaerota archaeon]
MCGLLLSRRDFLKISGVVSATFAISTQLPFSETLLREVSAEEAQKLKTEAEQIKTYVRELGMLGWTMGNNVTAVDVKGGKIIRIRPLHFDWQYKPEDFNYDATKIEVNGKIFRTPLKCGISYFTQGYKKRVYSPNRVKYPLKRVDWSPERPNSQNRGKSGFIRITWDEAINILVSEIKRISEKYGPSAILIDSEGHSQCKTVHGGALGWLGHLNYVCGMGWTIIVRNPDSWEGWYWGSKHVWGGEGMSAGGAPEGNGPNCYLDFMLNGELLIWWGGDPETTRQKDMTQQSASRVWFWLTDAGKKQIWITPDCNYSTCIHADKWIPILPSTDIALGLAIAYVWITEGIYDKKYVETHTFGFEDFKKYVLGEEDGIPKTPKWAEQICGVPARTIKALARTWAKKRTSVAGSGSALIRGPYTHEYGRVKAYLMAMQGLGKPGVQLVEFAPAIGLPVVAPTAAAGGPLIFMAAAPPPPGQPFLPKVLLKDAILNPPIEFYGTGAIMAPVEDQFVKYKFPQEGFSEIRMIWKEPACYIVCWNRGFIDAVRSPKIEFVVIQHPWLEDDCYFADLVLPGTTAFEDDMDIIAGGAFGGTEFSYIVYHTRIIEPIGESKSDLEIIELVAEKLGVRDKLTAWKTHEEAVRIAFETSGIADFISFDEFKKKQYWVAPVDPKWKEIEPGMRWYWKLPEGSKIKTKSGKIEFYCQWLAEHFPNDPERPPVAHYIPYSETHQESLVHPRAKQYPFLIISNHPRWRGHAMCDDITWLREIPTCKIRGPDGYLYEPLWIHPIDAAKKGIKHGDIVMVYNERGATLRAAYVTERIIPNAVGVDHGSRFDPISLEPLIDRGGSDNILSPLKPISKNTVGMVCAGFLVDVVKVDLDELKKKYPEAFQRKLADGGPCLEGWLVR